MMHVSGDSVRCSEYWKGFIGKTMTILYFCWVTQTILKKNLMEEKFQILQVVNSIEEHN